MSELTVGRELYVAIAETATGKRLKATDPVAVAVNAASHHLQARVVSPDVRLQSSGGRLSPTDHVPATEAGPAVE